MEQNAQSDESQAKPPATVRDLMPKSESQHLKAAAVSDRFCRYRKTYYLSTLLLLLLIALFVYLAWRLLFRSSKSSTTPSATTTTVPSVPDPSRAMTEIASEAATVGDVDVAELLAAL